MFIVTQMVACAGKKKKVRARDPRRFIQEHDLAHLPRFDVPIEVNDRVVAWMEYFQGVGRGHFRRYLERSGRYMPLMQDILKKHGLPQDLVYVALIESGFNTQARSWASAVGPWQFIQSTGRRYGLKIDGWVDERRDPYKSTHAASEYLRDLHEEFGDWYLAMAGYNGGEGRIRDAIDITGSRNFWEIAESRRALRPETRDYVPKFIAAAIMAKMPEHFGFDNVEYKGPFNFDRGTVETQTDLSQIAKCAGVGEDDILDLNPHLLRGATPPNARDYEIRLPKGTAKVFHERYAALPKEERIQIVRYQVRRGDTIAQIARRYGVSASWLASANGLRTKGRLHRGTTLIIPVGSSAARFATVETGDDEGRELQKRSGRKIHIVRRGETLTGIARRYGVTPGKLMEWNYLRGPKSLRPGMKLALTSKTRERPLKAGDTVTANTLGPAPRKEHRVQYGETLYTIARRYGVTTRQLMALNGLNSTKDIRPGMRLVIRKANDLPSAGTPIALGEGRRPEGRSSESRRLEGRRSTQSGSVGHKVRQGETLDAIAKKYNVRVRDLMAMNNIRNPKGVRAGTNIIVKGSSKKGEVIAQKEKEEAPVSKDAVASSTEVVGPDTTKTEVALISQTPAEVETPVNPEDKPLPAQSTEVPHAPSEASPKGEITYQVKNGDTLWEIARRHKVTIADIQKWNNLADPSAVKPGAMLKIYNRQ